MKILIAYIPIVGIFYICHDTMNAEEPLLYNEFHFFATAICQAISVGFAFVLFSQLMCLYL